MSKHLVVAEYAGGSLHGSTLSTITAAQKVGGDVIGLVVGQGVDSIATEMGKYVPNVVIVDDAKLANRLAQPWAQAIAAVAQNKGATHIWHGATTAGKDIMPRVAARLEAGMASDISAVVSENTFKRPMWAGNVIGTVEVTTDTKVVTVRPTEFDRATAGSETNIEKVETAIDDSRMSFVSFDEVKSDRPALTDADVVISGGRGLKGPEGFTNVIEPLADKLGAAIGASRAVCDAGWVPNDWQVGQTGKVVAPNLYFAVGLSGAIQHVAGMKGSKCIVAINKDEEAPIFQVADYGIVADLFDVVPELIEKL